MPGQHKNRDDYDPLFRRIEEAMDPEEMTALELKKYLNATTGGMLSLAEQLAEVSEIYKAIQKINNINDLRILEETASKLPIHSQTLIAEIREKIIAISIQDAEDFAEERGIILTEKTTARVESWRGVKVFVVREKGRFKAWKRM